MKNGAGMIFVIGVPSQRNHGLIIKALLELITNDVDALVLLSSEVPVLTADAFNVFTNDIPLGAFNIFANDIPEASAELEDNQKEWRKTDVLYVLLPGNRLGFEDDFEISFAEMGAHRLIFEKNLRHLRSSGFTKSRWLAIIASFTALFFYTVPAEQLNTCS